MFFLKKRGFIVETKKINKKSRFENNKFTNFRKNLFLNASMIEHIKRNVGITCFFRMADISDLVTLSTQFKQKLPDTKLLKAQAIEIIRKRRGYHARRLFKGLPVRGQRTHTNAKTRKKIKVE